MYYVVAGGPGSGEGLDFVQEGLAGSGLEIDIEARARASFVADYGPEIALAEDPQALVDHLDTLLTHGALEDSSKAAMIELLNDVPLERQDYQYEGDDGRHARTHFAVLMVMTAPEYLVQQ